MNEYCLSDKKLKNLQDPNRYITKIGKDQFSSEKDIFKFLDMDYVEPSDRNNITLNKII